VHVHVVVGRLDDLAKQPVGQTLRRLAAGIAGEHAVEVVPVEARGIDGSGEERGRIHHRHHHHAATDRFRIEGNPQAARSFYPNVFGAVDSSRNRHPRPLLPAVDGNDRYLHLATAQIGLDDLHNPLAGRDRKACNVEIRGHRYLQENQD
jgi:hypothetical protein